MTIDSTSYGRSSLALLFVVPRESTFAVTKGMLHVRHLLHPDTFMVEMLEGPLAAG